MACVLGDTAQEAAFAIKLAALLASFAGVEGVKPPRLSAIVAEEGVNISPGPAVVTVPVQEVAPGV